MRSSQSAKKRFVGESSDVKAFFVDVLIVFAVTAAAYAYAAVDLFLSATRSGDVAGRINPAFMDVWGKCPLCACFMEVVSYPMVGIALLLPIMFVSIIGISIHRLAFRKPNRQKTS
jgi:hypothetical protein